MMTTETTDWLILPYDGSAVARATLRRAAAAIRGGERPHTGVLLAVAGIEPEALCGLVQEAGAREAPDVTLQAQLLPPGDPLGALQRLVAGIPATLAAPVDAQDAAPWCLAAWRLDVPACAKVVFFLTPEDRRPLTMAGTPRPSATCTWREPTRRLPGSATIRALLLLGALVLATAGAVGADWLVRSHTAASWVYLPVVLPVALRWGWAQGVITAVLAAGLLVVVLVEPRFSFTVADGRDLGRVALSLSGMVGATLLVQVHGRHQADPAT